MSNTFNAGAHWPFVSCDYALVVADLRFRASFINKLVHARPDDDRSDATLRPVACNGRRNDDARRLARQFRWPADHVMELLDLLQRSIGNRDGHLTPGQRRIVRQTSCLWAGSDIPTAEGAVSRVIRFERGELTADEMDLVVANALEIVQIAFMHASHLEETLRAIGDAEQHLPGPRRLFIPNERDYPTWWEAEELGAYRAPRQGGGTCH